MFNTVTLPSIRIPMRISPFVILLLCGCYANVPLTTTPDIGTRVHVELTDQGSVDLTQYLGRNVASVDGRLLQGSDSAMSLSVLQLTTRSGDDQFWKGEAVTLPKHAIATVQHRKLSFWKSGLIAGALVAAAFVVGSQAGGSSSGGKRGEPPPVGK